MKLPLFWRLTFGAKLAFVAISKWECLTQGAGRRWQRDAPLPARCGRPISSRR